MTSAAAPVPDEDLEALFDSIARDNVPAAAPVAAAEPAQAAAPVTSENRAEHMLARIGNMTRTLHDSLRELGYDQGIERAASKIPDAKERLEYVATLTEQAAQRTLTAIELAKPIQDQLGQGAKQLGAQWERVLKREAGLDEFKALVHATRDYLGAVPAEVGKTDAHLLEIMMAQDFQDLTGQVIKKITDIIQTVEGQLVQLLVENTPPERRSEEANSLLNGPVVRADGRADIVTSQAQVDDLLESLGF